MYNFERSGMGVGHVRTLAGTGGITTNQKMPGESDCAGGLYDEEGVLLRLST